MNGVLWTRLLPAIQELLLYVCRFCLSTGVALVGPSSFLAINPDTNGSLCRYDNRSTVLGTCQTNWYDLDGNTSLTYEQLTAAQAALPCRLWGANYSDFSCVCQL